MSSDSCLEPVGPDRLARVARTVSNTSSRNKKVEHLAGLLAELNARQRLLAVSYLCGDLPQRSLGVGPALLSKLRARLESAAQVEQLTLTQLDKGLTEIKAISGAGSKERRLAGLAQLFERTTAAGQKFLLRLLGGGLRQGALAGVMEMAVVEAAGVEAGLFRRALTLAGSLPEVTGIALSEGNEGLLEVKMRLMRPVSPMLASPAEDHREPFQRWGESFWELKIDGARVQVHRAGDRIRVFSRSLRDVTRSVPEVVEAVEQFDCESCVLDGEVVALRPDGRCQPFQETMKRFGRAAAGRQLREQLPLRPSFFDLLMLDGVEVWERPFADRRRALENLAGEFTVRGQACRAPQEGARFLDEAIAAGYEGAMVKSPDGIYEAGRRGSLWLKLKPFHTLDLVVIGAEWGSGRRRGWLSNLHLATPDGAGRFLMLGKTFKGLSDDMLGWQTQRLLELEVERDEHTVYVAPKLVVEIAFNELQESSQYPAGLALRFARVKGYREDKAPVEADHLDVVRRIFHSMRNQGKALPPEETKT